VSNGRTKEAFWRKVAARFEASALTQAEFCRQEGLSQAKLSWWRKEIAARDAGDRKVARERPAKQDRKSKLAYWRKVVDKFNSSGLSMGEFCDTEEIKPASFAWWRAEIRRQDRTSQKGVVQPDTHDLFIPVGMADLASTTEEGQAIAEIVLISNKIRIFAGADAQTLAAIIKAMEGLVK